MECEKKKENVRKWGGKGFETEGWGAERGQRGRAFRGREKKGGNGRTPRERDETAPSKRRERRRLAKERGAEGRER